MVDYGDLKLNLAEISISAKESVIITETDSEFTLKPNEILIKKLPRNPATAEFLYSAKLKKWIITNGGSKPVLLNVIQSNPYVFSFLINSGIDIDTEGLKLSLTQNRKDKYNKTLSTGLYGYTIKVFNSFFPLAWGATQKNQTDCSLIVDFISTFTLLHQRIVNSGGSIFDVVDVVDNSLKSLLGYDETQPTKIGTKEIGLKELVDYVNQILA